MSREAGMSQEQARVVLRHMQVPKQDGLYVLGCFEKRDRLIAVCQRHGLPLKPPLCAAARLSHFERFARRDGAWSAQGSSLWRITATL